MSLRPQMRTSTKSSPVGMMTLEASIEGATRLYDMRPCGMFDAVSHSFAGQERWMLRHECMQCVNVDSASNFPVVHSLTTGPTETIRLYAIETYPCILGGLCLSEHSSSLSYRELVSLAVCRIAMATTRCQKVYALPQASCYSRSGNPQTRSWRCDSFI